MELAPSLKKGKEDMGSRRRSTNLQMIDEMMEKFRPMTSLGI